MFQYSHKKTLNTENSLRILTVKKLHEHSGKTNLLIRVVTDRADLLAKFAQARMAILINK